MSILSLPWRSGPGLAALFFLALLVVPAVRTQAAPFQPRLFALAMGSTLFGMVLGMCFLMAALHNDNVGIVSTLSSMTPVLILPLVWLRTRKSPSLRSWTGAILAILGTALISLH